MRRSVVTPKTTRRQLEPLEYQELCQQVLKRDNWRCQACGSMKQLEIHHKEFRSHGGQDSEENLVTLCDNCHKRLHTPPHPSDPYDR